MVNARQSSLLRSLKKPLLLLCLVGVPLGAGMVSGCGGGDTSGSGGGASGGCFDYSTFQANAAVKFSTDVLPLFQRSCGVSMSCHQNEAPASGSAQHYFGPAKGTTATAMQISEIFTQSVGVASVEDPDMKVIDPGKPESSFLMYKLDGEVTCSKLSCAAKTACAAPMPQGGAKLVQTELDTIRSWIKNGAMNN